MEKQKAICSPSKDHAALSSEEVQFKVLIFICTNTLCMQTVKTLASLCICEGSSQPSIPDNVISTKISCDGSNNSFWLMFYRTYLISLDKV